MKRNLKREAGWAALVLLLLFLASSAALVVNRALKSTDYLSPNRYAATLSDHAMNDDFGIGLAGMTEVLNDVMLKLAEDRIYAKYSLYEGDWSVLEAMSGTYLDMDGNYVSLDNPDEADAITSFLQELDLNRTSVISVSGYQNGLVLYPTEIVYDQFTVQDEVGGPRWFGEDRRSTETERKTLKLKANPPSEGMLFVRHENFGLSFVGSGDGQVSYADVYHTTKQKTRHVWEAYQKAAELEASTFEEARALDLSKLRSHQEHLFSNDNTQKRSIFKMTVSSIICLKDATAEERALYLTLHAVSYPLYDALSDLEMTLAFLFLFYLCVFIALLSNKFWKIYKQQNSAAQRQHDFTNALAHEMKTPMSVIRGYGEMLQENIAPSKEAAYLDGIVRETEHMDEMVTEILSFTRLDAESLPLHPTVFALDQMLYAQLRTFEVPMEDKKLRLHTDISEDVQVNASVKELVLAVRNLLSNAMKYTPEGGEIRIRLERKRGKAILEIYNQGQQIPKKSLPYLWDAFYRVDESRTRENRGSGMGLAVTKAILQRHRARFGVRNQTGGVCFWFALPLNRGRKGGGLI